MPPHGAIFGHGKYYVHNLVSEITSNPNYASFTSSFEIRFDLEAISNMTFIWC
jgi:hypothetical protein